MLNKISEWDSLSMRDRAAYIRLAVSRGLSNIDDIRLEYRLFGGGGSTKEEEPIYKVLPKLLLEAGLDIRVSSGYRPVGRAGTAGRKSWHWRHGAVDIVPLGKTTFEDIENVIYNNPKIKLYLLSHNFGLLDETGRTKESRALVLKTGATGPHFHFGRDTNAVNSYRARVGALQGGDNGKVAYFTNPFIPLNLEAAAPVSGYELGLSPEEVLASIVTPKPLAMEDILLGTNDAEVALPEVETVEQQETPNPLEILSLILESAPEQFVIQSYLRPSVLNKVSELNNERNTLLQKDLEDRILTEERRRKLGYSYRDDNILDDVNQLLFLRNISANGGRLFDIGGNTEKYNEEEDAYDAGTFPETYVTPFGNFNATLHPWLSALLTRSQQYDEVNPLLGDNETPMRLRSIVNGKPGRLNTAVIAPEWITRAALAALSKGYDSALPIALMSRESTIGNDTDGPTTAKLWSEENIEELRKLGVDPYKTEQHIGLPFRLSELRKQVRLNNIEEYPYVLPDLSYRYNTMIGNHDFYDDKFPYYRMYDEAINNVGLDRAAIDEWLSQNYKAKDFEAVPTDPIVDALDYYKTGKYNSGWKGQYPAVQREYNEVINNPLIMDIINNTRGLGGNLYGGGGITGITLGPMPGVTENETTRDILSWLPYTSTAIDLDNARRDPSTSNLTWAGISTGLDLLSFGLASKIKRGIKAVEKLIEPAEKAATSATKRAERAKKVYLQAPTHKNYELNLKAEREAFEKNYILNNQVNGLYKQLEDAQWYKSTWLPIMEGHGGVVSQGAQTLFEEANASQKALGGYLNPYLDANSYGGGGLMPMINIPSALKNGYNAVKNRLYRTITPQGYHLGRAAKEFIKGDTRDFSKFTPAENEVWARYLGVPYKGESSFEKAIYTPTLGGATYDDVIKFKDESQVLSDDALRQLLQNQMLTGKNNMLIEGNESGLGTYTLSLGEDENGKYISYYDDWDINPTRGISAKYKIPLIEQFGDIVPGSHPFTVYGRRYYTDEDLRRVIER